MMSRRSNKGSDDDLEKAIRGIQKSDASALWSAIGSRDPQWRRTTVRLEPGLPGSSPSTGTRAAAESTGVLWHPNICTYKVSGQRLERGGASKMTIPDEKFYRAQITRRVAFAPDLWMFRIRSGGEFNFVPGQYATLGVEHDGKRI